MKTNEPMFMPGDIINLGIEEKQFVVTHVDTFGIVYLVEKHTDFHYCNGHNTNKVLDQIASDVYKINNINDVDLVLTAFCDYWCKIILGDFSNMGIDFESFIPIETQIETWDYFKDPKNRILTNYKGDVCSWWLGWNWYKDLILNPVNNGKMTNTSKHMAVNKNGECYECTPDTDNSIRIAIRIKSEELMNYMRTWQRRITNREVSHEHAILSQKDTVDIGGQDYHVMGYHYDNLILTPTDPTELELMLPISCTRDGFTTMNNAFRDLFVYPYVKDSGAFELRKNNFIRGRMQLPDTGYWSDVCIADGVVSYDPKKEGNAIVHDFYDEPDSEYTFIPVFWIDASVQILFEDVTYKNLYGGKRYEVK